MSKIKLEQKKIIGRLDKGVSFKIRKNGLWYTVHAQVVEQVNDDNSNTGRGDFFTIAISNRKMYAFHYMDKYIESSVDKVK